jgi:hypothetical protein
VTSARLVLDEHVGRVFERLLRERGHDVEQAKDRFGEHTSDADLLEWCGENDAVLLTNNAKDFEPLHEEHEHAGYSSTTSSTSRMPIPRGSPGRWTRSSTSTGHQKSRTGSSTLVSGTSGFRSKPSRWIR